jgi:hypothetical protein
MPAFIPTYVVKLPTTRLLARNNVWLARDSDTVAEVARFSLLSLPIYINYG